MEPGSPAAVETVGNWYWVVDEIEQAGLEPKLVNARLAKLMMGHVNKTDKLDTKGLNRLQRTGTLPTVWIPPGPLRDARELPRARMVLVRQRTQLKNRIHATLAKYGLRPAGFSDIFGVGGRQALTQVLPQLPPHTAAVSASLLQQLDELQGAIDQLQERIAQVFDHSPDIELLRTLPGVGPILSVVIHTEIGCISRFRSHLRFASYSGTVATRHDSGGKHRTGRVSRTANLYLKWAFVEAANAAVLHRKSPANAHLVRLYDRVRAKRGHGKAIVATARHLAEAAFWVLTKQEPYRPPKSSTRG